MRVVDSQQQGALLGGVGEQPQRRHGDAEPVAAAGTEVERPLQGGGLRPGKRRYPVEERAEQQRERGVGDLALGLVAGDPDHPEPGLGDDRVGDHLVEQAGLADAGVTADRQRARRAGGRVGERRAETVTLRVASDQSSDRGHGGNASRAETSREILSAVPPTVRPPPAAVRPRSFRPYRDGPTGLTRPAAVAASRCTGPGWGRCCRSGRPGRGRSRCRSAPSCR